MLELKTRKEQATHAGTLASARQLVRYHNVTYVPADFETLSSDVVPDSDRTIWLPLTREKIRLAAADTFNTLFANDGELSSFDFMVAQSAMHIEEAVSSLLIRTEEGLRELDARGTLIEADGTFRANYLEPVLNTDKKEKARIFAVISGWLDSEEEAESLLSHLATSLAPGYSAVKYVILLGEGRNGKSVMLKMLQHLFGYANVSNVTRQSMAEQSAVVTELNGKLLNIIYDGRAEYLKDSGTEKSLVAGEPAPIRRLYESTATMVQTNALFLEALNREPKTIDKSSALQKRLVRFQFPNVYALDHRFERSMLTPEALGAFLSLLIDRYVTEDVVAERLRPTAKAMALQLEHEFANSMGLQFFKHLEETDPFGVAGLLGDPIQDLIPKFHSWRLKENDLGTWAEPDVLAQFAPLLATERKTQRVNGKPRKVRVVTAFKEIAAAFIQSLEGADEDADILNTLVDE